MKRKLKKRKPEKRMQKVVAAALAVVMVCSATACKKKSLDELNKDETESNTAAQQTSFADLKPEEGATLTYWTGDTEFGEEIAKDFEAKYGVHVTVEEVGLGALDKMTLDGPAGKGADVFMCPHDSFSQGIASGILLPIDSAVVSYLSERVDEVGMKTVTHEEKIYGVPVSLETSCLFYNKDIVGDTPAATLEEIMEGAASVNDAENNVFQLLYTIGDGYKVYPILSAFGFSLFGKDGTDGENPGFDTDEFEQGLELLSKLHDIMPISSTDLGNVSFLRSQFCDGKVAYEITGPWDVAEFKKSGVNFGVTTLPTYNGRELTPFAGVINAHVSAYTKYPVAAQLFAAYLVSDEAAVKLYDLAGDITTVKSVTEIEEFKNDECVQAFTKQFANSYPMPSTTRISYYWSISKAVAMAVFDQELTPKEGREKAMKDWKALIQSE